MTQDVSTGLSPELRTSATQSSAPPARSGGSPVRAGQRESRADVVNLCSGLSIYAAGRERQLVRNLDLHVRRGEVVALVGRSGSGKSTIAGLLFGGALPKGWEKQGEIADLTGRGALVYQHAGRIDHLAPADEIRLVGGEPPADYP